MGCKNCAEQKISVARRGLSSWQVVSDLTDNPPSGDIVDKETFLSLDLKSISESEDKISFVRLYSEGQYSYWLTIGSGEKKVNILLDIIGAV